MYQIFLLANQLKDPFFVLMLAVLPFSTFADTPVDSATVEAFPEVKLQKRPSRLIISTAMLGLGAAAIKNPALRDLNRSVRQHVLSTKPNVDHHFEDNIRHIPSATAFLLQAVGVKGRNNLLGKATVYALATTIADQTASRLKTVSRHQRPDGSDFRSFPSGHATTAFVAAEFLRKEYGDKSPWIAIAGYATASSVAGLRVYHNKHWLTDVMAGAGVGILSTNLAYFLHEKAKNLKNRKGMQRLSMLPAVRYGEVGLGLRYEFD
jgi:membrane-associated phospholipid phosphatase